MTSFRRLVVCAALALCLVPAATAQAATARYPTISSVGPKALGIGDKITIRGRHYISGRNRTVVVFKRDGARPVFVPATSATTTRLRVRIPAKLERFMLRSGATLRATRFRLRVSARRFGRRYTSLALSPVIQPAPDCDGDGIPNVRETDSDNDLLSDALEVTLRVNPCNVDTDGDGMEDGWEYESALDFNSRHEGPSLPYPGKRPYPNPLDSSDKTKDHDGDGLSAGIEHTLWKVTLKGHDAHVQVNGRPTLPAVAPVAPLPLSYSDGDQTSGDGNPRGGGAPIPAYQGYLDLNSSGLLSDDEKDVDGDAIGNYVELGVFGSGKPYPLDFLDWDSDGDRVADGLDDQDHDDLTNLEEIVNGTDGATSDPYNPCDPNPASPYCALHGADPSS